MLFCFVNLTLCWEQPKQQIRLVSPKRDVLVFQPHWNSCDAWQMWGTPNCGKGEPGQVGYVGHGAAPARFKNVQVGVMK